MINLKIKTDNPLKFDTGSKIYEGRPMHTRTVTMKRADLLWSPAAAAKKILLGSGV